ncbi:MAG: site-specific integrase [bacterium]|nr:site-specific integrase [bacterium]
MAVEVAPPAPSATSPSEQLDDASSALISGHAPEPGEAQPLEASPPPIAELSPQDDADFLLHPVELAKGRRAAENYLSTFRSDDSRKAAEEALETLATVISGGKCDSVDFPWQQVRPYHGAAALTILKEKGAPARIEALRCRADETRGYRVVPDSYPARQVQKIRSTLSKVIEECEELGFLPEGAEPEAASKPKKASKKAAAPRGRTLGDGELRALVAACAADGNAEGYRDAVFFCLVYRGLKIAEITGLTPESVKFNNKTGACTITARPKGGGRGRKVELSNDELIVLEDWLDRRGQDAGPLLCTLGRGGKVEGKRLTTAMLKALCEERAHQAEVPVFTPNDLSRSAEVLTNHRKATRRKANRLAQTTLSNAEKALYLPADMTDEDELNQTIQFPFLGLSD